MSGNQRIRRGSQPKRPTARRKVAAKVVQKASVIDRLIARLPLTPETLRKVATGAILATVGLGAAAVATMAGIPQAAGVELAEAAGRAGFKVDRVEVTGIRRMEKLTVYAIALDQHSMAMPLVDLATVRARLLDYGWIADARVSRRLPDTLLVDIVERTPGAVWQHDRRLWLVDAKGVVLEEVALDRMPDLPLVIGPDANRQIAGLDRLMQAAPALRPMLAGATWVGNRRWDLRFESGETLSLPEQDSARALIRFARMDGVDRLLGRGFVRFDMRDPERLVVRVRRGAAAITDMGGDAGADEAAGTATDRAAVPADVA